MTNKKQNSKRTVAILLFSVLVVSGCSSKRIVLQPIEDTTIEDAQTTYEHIPKPVAYEGEPISVQDKHFRQYLAKTFNEIDEYKKRLSKKGKRYGKNKLTSTDDAASTPTHTQKHQSAPRLYPKLEKEKQIKSTPLYGA